MPATTPPPAPAAEPVPEAAAKAKTVKIGLPSLHALIGAIPAVSLGVGFWLLIFREVPKGNSEIVLAIGSGLLGYLTHAVQTRPAGKATGDPDA